MKYIRLSQLLLQGQGQQTFQYIWSEPFSWLFFCFFQPARFAQELEVPYFWKRFALLLRLGFPTFLISYLLALLTQITLIHTGLANGSSTQNLSIDLILTTIWTTAVGIGCGIVGGLLGGIQIGIILGMAFSIGGIADNNTSSLAAGFLIAASMGFVGGIVGGATWRMRGSIVGGIVAGLAWGAWHLIQNITGSITVAVVFFVCYTLGYYRVLLYLISGSFWLWTYFISQNNPGKVFYYLHRSSLYWDEQVYIPLLGLKSTLLLVAAQNRDLFWEEIDFIITKRPQQIEVAQNAALEVLLSTMEMCGSIRDIANISVLLSAKAKYINPRWSQAFTRLKDTSRNAILFYAPLDWNTRYQTLKEMLITSEYHYSHSVLIDVRLNKRLDTVGKEWRAIIQREQEKMEQTPEASISIDNPYIPGQVLESHDSLFVGRSDIVQILTEALKRGHRRPTFLLYGERRMGKSSILRQLPSLLGASYFSIVYDLQKPSISRSLEGFLSTIAEEIYKIMNIYGLRVKRLEAKWLRGASLKNEAEVYRHFDIWLDNLETLLQRDEKNLFLLFDEFETLEESGKDGYLNLNLLLDWFRSTVQNRSHIALLFSGARTFKELGRNWTSHFVNVQELRVSFLHPNEAMSLIKQPTPDFPGQDIFREVAEQVIYVTGGHPFLIQATCSMLINELNADGRDQATSPDVTVAMNQVLENWGAYFQDLWERSDQNQQMCLIALNQLREGNVSQIAQASGLDEKVVRHTLQILLHRDLAVRETSNYRIAAPFFSGWVEHSS